MKISLESQGDEFRLTSEETTQLRELLDRETGADSVILDARGNIHVTGALVEGCLRTFSILREMSGHGPIAGWLLEGGQMCLIEGTRQQLEEILEDVNMKKT